MDDKEMGTVFAQLKEVGEDSKVPEMLKFEREFEEVLRTKPPKEEDDQLVQTVASNKTG